MRGQGGAWSLVCELWAPGDPQFQCSLPVTCGALPQATDQFPSYSWELVMENERNIEKRTFVKKTLTNSDSYSKPRMSGARRRKYQRLLSEGLSHEKALEKSKFPLNPGNKQTQKEPQPSEKIWSKEEIKKMSSILPNNKLRNKFVTLAYYKGYDPDEVMKNMLSDPAVKDLMEDLELTGCAPHIPAKFKNIFSQRVGEPSQKPRLMMERGALANQGINCGSTRVGPPDRNVSDEFFTQQCQRLVSNMCKFEGPSLQMLPLSVAGMSSNTDGEPLPNDMVESFYNQPGFRRSEGHPRAGQDFEDRGNSNHQQGSFNEAIANLPGVGGPLKEQYERLLKNVSKIGGFGNINMNVSSQSNHQEPYGMLSELEPSTLKKKTFSEKHGGSKKRRFMGEAGTHGYSGMDRGSGPMGEGPSNPHQTDPIPPRRPPLLEDPPGEGCSNLHQRDPIPPRRPPLLEDPPGMDRGRGHMQDYPQHRECMLPQRPPLLETPHINQNGPPRLVNMTQRPEPDREDRGNERPAGSVASRKHLPEEKRGMRPAPNMMGGNQPRQGVFSGKMPSFEEGPQSNIVPVDDVQGDNSAINYGPRGNMLPFNYSPQSKMPQFNTLEPQANNTPCVSGQQGNIGPFSDGPQGNMMHFNVGTNDNIPPFNTIGPQVNMPPSSMLPFNVGPQGNVPLFNNGPHSNLFNVGPNGSMPPFNYDCHGNVPPNSTHNFGPGTSGLSHQAASILPKRSNEENCQDGDTKFPLYIVPHRYPSERFSEEQMDAIEIAILDAILEIDDERLKPSFQESFRSNGRYGVICSNQHSINWLFCYLPKCQPWPYASFKIVLEMPPKIQAEAVLPLCKNDENNKILKFIAKQNTKLNVGQWEVMRRVDGISNTCLSLSIDEESACMLRENSKINFKMGRADIIVEGLKADHGRSTEIEDGRSNQGYGGSGPCQEVHSESSRLDCPGQEFCNRDMIQLPTPPHPPALGDAVMLFRSPEYEPSRSDRFFRTPSPELWMGPAGTRERSGQRDPHDSRQVTPSSVDRARPDRIPTSGRHILRDGSIDIAVSRRRASVEGKSRSGRSQRIPDRDRSYGGSGRSSGERSVDESRRRDRPSRENPSSNSETRSSQPLYSRNQRPNFPSHR